MIYPSPSVVCSQLINVYGSDSASGLLKLQDRTGYTDLSAGDFGKS